MELALFIVGKVFTTLRRASEHEGETPSRFARTFFQFYRDDLMDARLRQVLLSFTLVLACSIACQPDARGQAAHDDTRTFTYQGFLEEAGQPADGAYDFRFTLLDAESGGTTVGVPVTHEDVEVRGGVFSVGLNFGEAFDSGEMRFLQIAVREGASADAYTTLAPNEILRPTPSAIVAHRALTLPNVTVDESGNVGIGTDMPTSPLTVDGLIEATSGGIRFPDGSTQTTAAGGSSGGGSAWLLGGNAGTDPSSQYIGTSDDTPLELRVNGLRAFRLESTFNELANSSVVNVLGGHFENYVSQDVTGATISGGGLGASGGENLNAVLGDYGTVGGGIGNRAAHSATTGGGWTNRALGQASTVAGGENNEAGADHSAIGGGDGNSIGATADDNEFGTIGGGSGNQVGPFGARGTIGGGYRNIVGFVDGTIGGGAENEIHGGARSTIGGGDKNLIDARNATIGGGKTNTAQGNSSTIAGGRDNLTDGTFATVGGGDANQATGSTATVAGGTGNVASGEESTVSGGQNNVASGSLSVVAGGSQNVAAGFYSVVPGGSLNQALATRSFAAGDRAVVHEDHYDTFVWSSRSYHDGSVLPTMFESTGPTQFLVYAQGGVGINTNEPLAPLTVQAAPGLGAPLDGAEHIAYFNRSTTLGGSVLALRSNVETPGNDENFITFKGANSDVGAIQGNGSGGVELISGGADFAEMLPRRNADERIEPGDIVGVTGGTVSLTTDNAERVMVVSDRALVVGNAPASGADRYEKVTFIGQVPVRVRGPVAVGDWIVASGNSDGVGLAVSPDDWTPGIHGPIVGQAWEVNVGGSGLVNTAIGLDMTKPLMDRIARQQQSIDELTSRLARIERVLGLEDVSGGGDHADR